MIAWLAEALIASSILMAVVLLIRRPVANQFGPRVAYCLWLIPALRMVLPPLPESWLIRAVETPALSVADASIASSAVASAVDWMAIGISIWALGAALHFALHLWSYRRFAVRAIARADFLQEVDPGAIEVFATPEVSGPLAMGLTKPSILVPTDFHDRYDEDERASALAHEVAHHRRGDLKVNLGALALLSLHWFNPLAHAAYRAFRVDQELACDAMIMAGADAQSRHAYGRALVKSACDSVPLAACALDRTQELKRRLTMMQPGRLTALRSAIGGAGAVALLAGGMLLTATAGANRESVAQLPVRVATAEAIAAPAVPVAPAQGDSAKASSPLAKAERQADRAAKLADRAAIVASSRAVETETAHAAATVEHKAATLAMTEAAADAERASHEAQKAIAEAQTLAANDAPVQVHLVRSIVLENGVSVMQRATYLTTDGDMRTALIKALEDAAGQVSADNALSDEQRAQALQAIDTRIAKIKSRQFPVL